MLQKFTVKKEKGFTLIELMIVIAIIGILAAIAVPQFLTYRMRAYNSSAKAIAHNAKADNSNLNSELGIYGHTEAVALNLTLGDNGFAAADSSNVAALRSAASATVAGARLVGTTTVNAPDLPRTLAIGIAIGDNMILSVQDQNNENNQTTYIIASRHFKGNTAYGIDADIENAIYAVSNDTWPNNNAIMATVPALAASGVGVVVPILDDFAPAGVPAAGGGAPTVTWAPSN